LQTTTLTIEAPSGPVVCELLARVVESAAREDHRTGHDGKGTNREEGADRSQIFHLHLCWLVRCWEDCFLSRASCECSCWFRWKRARGARRWTQRLPPSSSRHATRTPLTVQTTVADRATVSPDDRLESGAGRTAARGTASNRRAQETEIMGIVSQPPDPPTPASASFTRLAWRGRWVGASIPDDHPAVGSGPVGYVPSCPTCPCSLPDVIQSDRKATARRMELCGRLLRRLKFPFTGWLVLSITPSVGCGFVQRMNLCAVVATENARGHT